MTHADQRPPAASLSRLVLPSCALVLLVAAALLLPPGAGARVGDISKQTKRVVDVADNDGGIEVGSNGGAETGDYATLSGRVLYADTGQPVRRARLTLIDARELNPTGTIGMTVTNGRGEYRFREVYAGSYFVTIDAPGVVSLLSFVESSAPNDDAPNLSKAGGLLDEIIVDGTGDVRRDLRAVRGGAITGAVAYADGTPAVNVRVQIMRRAAGKLVPVAPNLSLGLGAMRTDDRGVYRVAGLPAGEYFVRAAEMNTEEDASERGDVYGDLFTASNALAVTYYPSASVAREAAGVEVKLGGEKSGIDIILPERRANRVDGVVVRRREGTPVANAAVRITRVVTDEAASPYADDQGGHSATTDAAGRWSFDDVPAGDYTLAVTPSAEGGNMNLPMVNMNGNMSGSPGGNLSGNLNGNISENLNGNTNAANLSIPASAAKRPPQLVARRQRLKVEDADIPDVRIELALGGRISGRVVFEGDKPTNGYMTASFVLVGTDGAALSDEGATRRSTFVPDSGLFEIDGVPAVDLFLSIYTTYQYRIDNGMGGMSTGYYIKSATANGADLLREPVRIGEGGRLADVRIVMARDAGRLTGRVLSTAEGAPPLADRAVMVVPADTKLRRNPALRRSTVSDLDGRYDVELPPGEYLVIVLPRGSEAEGASLAEERAASSPAARVSLRANERRSEDLIAAP